MTFEEYLAEKKIDSKSFAKKNKAKFDDLKFHFDQMHPNSFTAQKLFLINKIRRSFPLKELKSEASKKKKIISKPKINPKPKI